MKAGGGLYIHIPFCQSKCTYCAFYSVADPTYRASYVKSLVEEANFHAQTEAWKDHVFESIYIGGGTPSILPISDIVYLFEEINKIFDISKVKEISFELNPEHKNIIEELHSYTPINRLSIGIQSFNDERLKFMRRKHSSSDAIQSVEKAHTVGFNNISTDLIYGLPNMNLKEWEEQINIFSALDISHLSAYALTVEPNTILQKHIEKGLVSLPDSDTLFEQFMYLFKWGIDNNYEAYEVSNWAKDKSYAIHNTNYWNINSSYLGLGPGAHSFVNSVVPTRQANIHNISKYISEPYSQESFTKEFLSEKDLYHEYIMTALRTCKGIEKKRLSLFSFALVEDFYTKVKPFISSGLITESEVAFVPSVQALYKADGIAVAFF